MPNFFVQEFRVRARRCGIRPQREGTHEHWIACKRAFSAFRIALVLLAAHCSVLAQTNVLVAWGDNRWNQTNVPSNLISVVDIAAGRNHTLALLRDGTVVAWGTNDFGQLDVPPGLSNVTAIAAGGYHNLALQADGTLVAWGRNTYGQATIHPAATNTSAIAAGDNHSVILRADGTVVGWGYSANGQTNFTSIGLQRVNAIAAGGNQSAVLYADGTCKAWGSNGYGPPTPPGNLSNVCAIFAGANVCASLKLDGTVVVWGNSYDLSYRIPPPRHEWRGARCDGHAARYGLAHQRGYHRVGSEHLFSNQHPVSRDQRHTHCRGRQPQRGGHHRRLAADYVAASFNLSVRRDQR